MGTVSEKLRLMFARPGLWRWMLAVTLTAFLMSGECLAQSDSGKEFSYAADEITPPKLALKWSPFHLYYFFSSWQFALEHKLTKRINIQYDAGWVTDFRSNDLQYQDSHGLRAAVELRYFLRSPRMVPMYVAAEYYYHDIRFDRTETIGVNCIGSDCDYYQYATYTVKNREQGPTFKFGLMLFPAWHRNRSFFFDFNAGFAYRSIDYSYGSRPAGPNMRYFGDGASDWNFLAPREDISSTPRFVVGIRIAYRII